MSHAGPPPPEWYDAPRLIDQPPDGPIWQARASAWCGAAGHPREVVVRRTGAALEGALRAWRCPTCGGRRW